MPRQQAGPRPSMPWRSVPRASTRRYHFVKFCQAVARQAVTTAAVSPAVSEVAPLELAMPAVQSVTLVRSGASCGRRCR